MVVLVGGKKSGLLEWRGFCAKTIISAPGRCVAAGTDVSAGLDLDGLLLSLDERALVRFGGRKESVTLQTWSLFVGERTQLVATPLNDTPARLAYVEETQIEHAPQEIGGVSKPSNMMSMRNIEGRVGCSVDLEGILGSTGIVEDPLRVELGFIRVCDGTPGAASNQARPKFIGRVSHHSVNPSTASIRSAVLRPRRLLYTVAGPRLQLIANWRRCAMQIYFVHRESPKEAPPFSNKALRVRGTEHRRAGAMRVPEPTNVS